MINKIFSNSKIIVFSSIVICFSYVLLTFLIAFSTVYSTFDKKTKQFSKDISLFYDDGGMYVSEFIIFTNREYFENQEWFKQIQNNITFEDMTRYWNYWGAKVKILTSPFYRNIGWMAIVSTLNKFTCSPKEAFRLSILILPVFILLKYLFLLITFRKQLFIVLFLMLLLDFAAPYGHAYYWFTISAYAWVFFSTGMILRFFYNQNYLKSIILAYSFMIIGTLMSLMCLPVILVFITVELSLLFPVKYTHYVNNFVKKNFLKIFFFLLASLFVIIWIYLPYNIIQNLNNNQLIWHYANKIFGYQNHYFSIYYIFVILLFHYLSSQLNDKKIVFIRYSLLLFIFGGFLAVLINPFAPFLLKNTSLARILPYIYSTAIIGILYTILLLQKNNNKTVQTRKDIRYIICGLLLFGFLMGYDKYNSYNFWKPHKYGQYMEFSDQFVPVLKTDEQGYKFYSASMLQQVIVYIIDEYYKKGPMILENIETNRYSRKRVLKQIKKNRKVN